MTFIEKYQKRQQLKVSLATMRKNLDLDLYIKTKEEMKRLSKELKHEADRNPSTCPKMLNKIYYYHKPKSLT
jgi:hypothetical protein